MQKKKVYGMDMECCLTFFYLFDLWQFRVRENMKSGLSKLYGVCEFAVDAKKNLLCKLEWFVTIVIYIFIN